jgi:lipid A 3-O-deacylase
MRRCLGMTVLLTWLVPSAAIAQDEAPPASATRAEAVDEQPEPAPVARGYRTRALIGGWGHSTRYGWPGYGKARSDVQYVGFYPQMGWFVTDWLELYGEGTAHLYYRPHPAFLGGVVGIGGRHHFLRDRAWVPYYTLAGGMAWTSLDVPEVDRIWNFQVVWGAGIRRVTRRGPGLVLEYRIHHISNAGTRGENLGINAAMLVAGVHWVLR